MDVFEKKYCRCSMMFRKGQSADADASVWGSSSLFHVLTWSVCEIRYAASEIGRRRI